ncbi:DNA adenine methylase [Pseudomonas aeruginosa]|uniref:DNA adenine methylase n=1 Tax=Pseudomonas aeruginosa TaxID=287 RepID=UPI0013601421|nr:DNA adenine methylase [Pseudomonas aeruginosa]MBH9023134.1 DNA adenine methylase [Pseudomonas aeruginosa]MWW03618.1 DNA adenine methylase [Pseudomonas aeruginosa]
MGATKIFSTPLRYPGGKGKFSHFIKQIFTSNNLFDGHYVEPYAGGAGVALELLFHEYASTIHINDIDPAIYSFWHAATQQTEQLCKLIHDTPVTMENWRHYKQILENTQDHSTLDVAMATFFLNRTNRSGILKAGVIGGQDQAGKWKLDARYNKKDLTSRIELIGRFKERIKVYNQDAIQLLTETIPLLPEKTLIYLDPPYYVKGSGLYRNYYTHDDHVQISETMAKVKHPWLVSYDNVKEIKDIYSEYRQDEYILSYTAQEKKKGSEVMIYGPSILPPHFDLREKPVKNTAI